MDCGYAQCSHKSGSGWRCSEVAAPGRNLCEKHRKDKGKIVKDESYQRKYSDTNCEKGAREALTEDKTEESDCRELPEDNCIELLEKEHINQIPTDTQENPVKRSNEYDGINPSIIRYISQKAEEVRIATNELIQSKAISLQEELFKEVQKLLINSPNNEAATEKIGTRFELPFFQRGLEHSKYKYASRVIESLSKKSSQSLTSDICNLGVFSLRRDDLFSLRPTGWLSAGVIGAYAAIITDLSTDGTSSVHILNPFIYNTLQTQHEGCNEMMICDFSYVEQFKDILDGLMGCDPTMTKILIPVNLCDLHWGLIIVNMLKSTITMLDSKFTSEEATERYEEPMKLIVRDLARAFKLSTGASTEKRWIIETYRGDHPKQSNEYDCGLYVLAYMECIARGKQIVFEEDVSSSRLVIVSDLIDYVICGD